MTRREFITLVGGAVAWPLAARAQAPMPVIGFLHSGSPEPYADLGSSIPQRLRRSRSCRRPERGIEFRWAAGQDDRLPDFGRRSDPPAGGHNRHARQHTSGARGQSCNNRGMKRTSVPLPCRFIAVHKTPNETRRTPRCAPRKDCSINGRADRAAAGYARPEALSPSPSPAATARGRHWCSRVRAPGPTSCLRLFETFSGAPLIGPIVNRYFARYGSVYSTRPSEQVRGLFERWSIKLSADYYEAKDREEGRNGPR